MVQAPTHRLAIGDHIAIAVGILAAAVAIAAVALEHAYPEASTGTWRVLLFASAAVGAGAVFYLIYDLVARPRWSASLEPATWTSDGKVRGGKTRAALAIIALCILLGVGFVASHWPTGFLKSQSPRPENLPETTGPLLSRLSYFVLNCNVPPPPPGKSLTDTLWELQDYKQKLDVLGDVLGVTFTMDTIRGGVRIDVEATTERAKERMPLSKIGVTKVTLEIRRIEKVEMVSVIVKMPPEYAFYDLIPPNPAAPDSILLVQTVEHFLGMQPRTCQIV
jgi:hypothetical protein